MPVNLHVVWLVGAYGGQKLSSGVVTGEGEGAGGLVFVSTSLEQLQVFCCFVQLQESCSVVVVPAPSNEDFCHQQLPLLIPTGRTFTHEVASAGASFGHTKLSSVAVTLRVPCCCWGDGLVVLGAVTGGEEAAGAPVFVSISLVHCQLLLLTFLLQIQ